MHFLNRRRITLPIAFVALLGAVVFGLTLKTRSQQLRPSNSTVIDERLQQVEKSTDQPLRVVGNEDSPLRILEAKVKEISGPDFTKLTGRQTSLPTVSSVPEVRLLNSSAKTITGFVLVVRDPASKSTRGVIQNKVEIAQGETYTAPRKSFLRSEWVSDVDKEGGLKSRFASQDINSEKYWISFAGRSDLFVTVARVSFEDGSSWTLREGGDVK